MTAFDALRKGSKVDCHFHLYEEEVSILDSLCEKFECSRAAAVGALLREMQMTDLTGKVPTAVKAGTRSRRR